MPRDTKASTVESTSEFGADASPLAQIYREHVEFVWAVLRRLGVDEADVEDAAQDVFVVAHRRLGEFEGRAAVRTWLYSIALRVASNRRRKHARRDALLQRMPRAIPEDLEELAARGQARAILESLLDRLDEHKRVVFVLAELEELTVPVIADMVGENPRTIYSRLRAARASVATALDRLHGPPRIELDAAIVAARPRPRLAPERARRAWALVVAKLASDPAVVPVAAGLGAWTKLALVGGLGVAVWTGAAAIDDEPTAGSTPASTDAPSDPAAVEAPATLPRAATVAASPVAPTRPTPTPTVTPRRAAATERNDGRTAAPAALREAPTERSLAAELAALDRVRELLARTSADAAIAELDRYDARFTDGALRREADGLRVAALCELGRDADAQAHAARSGLPRPRCDLRP